MTAENKSPDDKIQYPLKKLSTESSPMGERAGISRRGFVKLRTLVAAGASFAGILATPTTLIKLASGFENLMKARIVPQLLDNLPIDKAKKDPFGKGRKGSDQIMRDWKRARNFAPHEM
jgi:hypothetical protein